MLPCPPVEDVGDVEDDVGDVEDEHAITTSAARTNAKLCTARGYVDPTTRSEADRLTPAAGTAFGT